MVSVEHKCSMLFVSKTETTLSNAKHVIRKNDLIRNDIQNLIFKYNSSKNVKL
jgi:hypothetical protein